MGRNLIITGGGTGGHLYPGIAVAADLMRIDPELQIIFIGAKRGIEAKLLPKENYKFHLLNIGPLNQVSFVQKIGSVLLLFPALIQCFLLILKYKPIHILGFGGYASGPLMLMGVILRRKCSLWEGNAKPGMVTRSLAKYMSYNFLAFPSEASCYPESTKRVFGVPVRRLYNSGTKESIGSRPLRIFVFGGSQGSLFINKLIIDLLESESYREQASDFEWIHQVGSYSFSEFKRHQGKIKNYQMLEFVYDMQQKYEWADLVICRSGASTLAEISQMALPSILIPLPTAADDHQKKNAEVFSMAGAAIMKEQSIINEETLRSILTKMKSDPLQLEKMAKASFGLAQTNSAQKIAEQLLIPPKSK